MKRTLEQKQDLSSTTPEINDKLQIKENSHFFNHIEKLAAEHDVYVSSTMIKVTYKKVSTTPNAPDNTVNISSENNSEPNEKKKRKQVKSKDLCNSDISLILKSSGTHDESKATAHHSTPKPQGTGNDKKKKYVNGVTVSVKASNAEDKNPQVKVQKNFSSKEDIPSSPKKSKTVNKQDISKRFLTGKVSSVKSKGSVIQKNSSETKKKITVNKVGTNKKLKKLEKGVKKKMQVDKKGVKRKASEDLNVLAKRVKINDNKLKKVEDGGKFEVKYKLGGSGKKQIMLVDPDLPTGWRRYIRTKNKGSANEQYVVYVVNPQGKKFRFKWKLRKYLEKTKSSLDVDRFYFGLYRRPKSSSSSATNKEEKSKNGTPSLSKGKSSSRSESQKSLSANHSKQDEESNDDAKGSVGKELLLYDPDLPFGWKRVIHSNNSSGKKQVHIISPDGKIFRRRYRLNEYLLKHQYTHNPDRFYFGLYPKKESNSSENSTKEGRQSGEKISTPIKSNNHGGNNKLDKEGSNEELVKAQKKEDDNYASILGNRQLRLILRRVDEEFVKSQKKEDNNYASLLGNRQLRLILRRVDEDRALRHEFVKLNGSSKVNPEVEKDVECKGIAEVPMYDDPKLPKGWKRFIKIRSCGESAGRMEVVIISPDGRRHRSKKHLEHYLLQKDLGYKADDFDFHVFGKSSLKKIPETEEEPDRVPETEPEPEPHSEPNDASFPITKRKSTDKPVPDLDLDSLKDVEISPEGRMINEVNGLMLCCGLSSARNIRRQRLPRAEVEKQVADLLSSEDAATCHSCEIPTYWIQRLVKCRGDLRTLDPNAVSIVGQATENFIRKMSFLAFSFSKQSDGGLRYEDVAELVHDMKSLAPLRTLIPKKITFKEFVRLNRPKQFLSFT